MTSMQPPRSLAPATGADRGEIRAVADQLIGILERLRDFEERKRAEALGSDEFVALAEQAEVQGRLIFRWTGLQLELARDAASHRALGQLDPDVRLLDVEPRKLDRILAAWREAQFRLEIARPGSPEAEVAADNIERLRDEYRAVASSLSDEAAELASYPPATSRTIRSRR
jgi:hypothetical protein